MSADIEHKKFNLVADQLGIIIKQLQVMAEIQNEILKQLESWPK